MDNRLIREALDFDIRKSKAEHQHLHSLLNPEQRLVYKDVVQSVHNKKGNFYFVYGPGGTGIASLLLPAGRTAHSRFVIPLELMENSTCGIKQNTQLAELMQEVQLIIWDEAPMTQRYAFEALDTTLRDILGFKDSEKRHQIFGGMTVLLGGDFRQILPVIPQAKRPEVVQSCINKSELWRYCKVFTLTPKMKEGEDEPTWIDIPEKFLIKTWECPIRKIVEETYPDFNARHTNDEYLKERAILTPRNDDADAINEFMFKQLPGESVTYNSANEVCMASTDNIDQHQLYPVEFLNSLNFPGMPPHELHLKKELPIMLLRNLNPSQGLCNGTRLIITDVARFVIHAKILTGSHIGDEVVIHRIILTSPQSKWPFVLKRRQLPVKPCYDIGTINKARSVVNYVAVFTYPCLAIVTYVVLSTGNKVHRAYKILMLLRRQDEELKTH
ncbi:ATP-dependent DNA helicase PIF1-like protein [Tanacetum coccineum]